MPLVLPHVPRKKGCFPSIDPVFVACQVLISIFTDTDALSPVPATAEEDEDAEHPMLTFNVYCPKLSKSADIDLPHAMQKMMTGKIRCGYVQGVPLPCRQYAS